MCECECMWVCLCANDCESRSLCLPVCKHVLVCDWVNIHVHVCMFIHVNMWTWCLSDLQVYIWAYLFQWIYKYVSVQAYSCVSECECIRSFVWMHQHVCLWKNVQVCPYMWACWKGNEKHVWVCSGVNVQECVCSLKKLEIELPYDPAIPLLGIHTEETRIERDTCTPVFIAALFIIARTWKQPRCP